MLGESAAARPTSADRDGRPNILVVMTDDMAATDVALMPNVQRLLAGQGTTFDDAIDSFPLCCPARATFITGQYAHNHGVEGNFAPFGWYGMKQRGNTLPSWLQDAGYRTALVGKWLNGYGARDAHGEIPPGFDIWRGLLDVSAYDYYNYVMNRDGKLRSWGDKDFARGLVEFARSRSTTSRTACSRSSRSSRRSSGRVPTATGASENPRDYSPDVTGEMTEELVRAEKRSKKPFFIWWSVAAPHREDVSTTLMGRPGPDPRPAPRYADEVRASPCRSRRASTRPTLTDKSSPFDERRAGDERRADRAAATRLPGAGGLAAGRRRPRRRIWSRRCARRTS